MSCSSKDRQAWPHLGNHTGTVPQTVRMGEGETWNRRWGWRERNTVVKTGALHALEEDPQSWSEWRQVLWACRPNALRAALPRRGVRCPRDWFTPLRRELNCGQRREHRGMGPLAHQGRSLPASLDPITQASPGTVRWRVTLHWEGGQPYTQSQQWWGMFWPGVFWWGIYSAAIGSFPNTDDGKWQVDELETERKEKKLTPVPQVGARMLPLSQCGSASGRPAVCGLLTWSRKDSATRVQVIWEYILLRQGTAKWRT